MAPYIFRISLFLFLQYSLHVGIITANASSLSTATLCLDHERSALLHFKQSVSLSKSASYDSSAYPKTQSWKGRGKGSSDCCSWHGVECNGNTGHVIGLHLNSSLLDGTLSSNSTIFSLVHLQTLNLADNNFSESTIPPEIINLTSLSSLNLSLSAFSGQIPLELLGLSELTSLDLFENRFYGEFPLEIFHLPDLLILNVSKNYNLNGLLPEFNQTSSLRGLELFYTNFSGNLPVSIGNLQSLTSLRIGGCNFSGSIPASIGNLTQLTRLSLSSNSFTNSVELFRLDKLSKLTVLNLDNTNIHGDLPTSLSNLTQLTSLGLAHNHFSGPIPGSFSQLKDLKILYLQGNNLTGAVEVDIFLGLRKLTHLGLSFNKITLLTNHSLNLTLPKLEFLLLNSCNLSEIPYFLQFQNHLQVLYLNGNNIYGNIPQWIWNVSDHMEAIDLSGNFLTAIANNPTVIPAWLGSLPRLQVLLLNSNKFHGAMGSAIIPGQFPMVRIIDLSCNSLSGNLPVGYIQMWNAMKISSPNTELYIYTDSKFETQKVQWIESYRNSITLRNKGVRREYNHILNNFTAVDLSRNNFTGKIPKSFGSLEWLQLLDLSNNDLTGPIPPSLGNLTQLESLDLSKNKLSGVIPEQLAAQLNFLSYFNVSHNLLSGYIPQGPQFKTFNSNSYMENSGLCGFPLSKNCGTVQSLPDDNEDDSDENKSPSGFDWLFILVGLGSGLVIGYVMGDIVTDRHPWLIRRIVQKFGRTQKKSRTRKRQAIRI
ncbi:hypothetical protein AgCh_003127 [Apium graveolens]